MGHYKKAFELSLSSRPLVTSISCFPSHLDYRGRIFIHDKEEFPSITTQSTGSIAMSEHRGKHYLVRKTKLSSVSTSNEKCIEHDINVCKDIEGQKNLKDQYLCHIPLLYSGNHLPKSDSLRVCNSTVTHDAIENMTKATTNCQATLPCEYSRYALRSFDVDWDHKDLLITVDENLEVHNSYVPYGIGNLMGEVGGTLGMCVGWSILFFTEVLITFLIKNKITRKTLHRMSIIIIITIFLYWSSDFLKQYNEESESMELTLEKENYPPHIMLCKIEHGSWTGGPYWGNPFMEWFNEKHPCSKDTLSYKDGVKKCLMSSANIVEDLVLYSVENDLPTATLTSDNTSVTLPQSSWTKVFHENLGVCYTLDTTLWTR